MKKLRLMIRVTTAVLIVLTVAGIILLLVNRKLDIVDTSYEIIALALGATGMMIAVLSEVGYYHEEKQTRRLLEEISQLNREHDEDEKVDQEFQEKLDNLLRMDRKIYQKLSPKSRGKK
jgi:type VI protein secretion system component VasK